MNAPRVDRLEVAVYGGGFAPYQPAQLEAALQRATEDDAVGIVRERLSDGRQGRAWRVGVDTFRLFGERRVTEMEEAA